MLQIFALIGQVLQIFAFMLQIFALIGQVLQIFALYQNLHSCGNDFGDGVCMCIYLKILN